jgi:hypothetical protein
MVSARWVGSLFQGTSAAPAVRETYERCCFLKSFHYYVDDETGEVVRSVPLDKAAWDELEKAVAAQREKFIAKYAASRTLRIRSSSTWTRSRSARTPRRRCMPPESSSHLIYAYEETGLIVTQENRRLIPERELRELEAKVREFYDLQLGDYLKSD